MVTYDPVGALVLHNSKTLTNKETHAVAPFWEIHAAAGPFVALSGAYAYAQDLADTTRNAPRKRLRAMELAEAYGVKLYTNEREPPGGMLDYLQKNAPVPVLDAYERAIALQQSV